MRRLLLLRHGHAEDKRPGETDRDRRLSQQGIAEATWAGITLRKVRLTPDLILISPARRTLETAQALPPWKGAPNDSQVVTAQIVESLYLASAETIAQTVRMLGQAARIVLVVGHNPGLQELACQLAGPAQAALTHFPPASLARFSVGQDWPTLDDLIGVQLVDFTIPPTA